MPAARYWRAVGLESHAGGDLELSALHVYDAGGRVDAGATLTSTIAPAAGALESLQDSDFGTTARFATAAVSSPGFALRWDFGAPVDVYGVRAGGPAAGEFLKSLILQYSSDGNTWSDDAAEFGDFVYPGSAALTAAPNSPPWFASQRGLWEAKAMAAGVNWTAIGYSADGMRIFAGTQGGALYASTDAGKTWAAVTGAGTGSWLSVSLSDDGSKILAGTGTSLRRSSDGGTTWVTFNPVGTESWSSVKVSKDGQKMYAAGYSLYWSADGGATWTKYANTGTTDTWRDISVSDDGQVMVASTSVNGRMLYSGDAGATWASRRPAAPLVSAWSIGASGSGQTILIGAIAANPPQISKDGGITWAELPALGSRIWVACRVSEDGQSLLAVSAATFAYLSLDGGATWRAVPGLSTQLYSGALSRDGLKMAIGSSGNTIPLFVARDRMFADPPPRTIEADAQEFFASSPIPDFTTIKLPDVMPWRDMEFAGNGKVTGTVKEKNTPANTPLRRRVRLVREIDGLQIRETWSDAATGAYEFLQIDERHKYSVISYDYLANYRAVIADSLTPEIMT